MSDGELSPELEAAGFEYGEQMFIHVDGWKQHDPMDVLRHIMSSMSSLHKILDERGSTVDHARDFEVLSMTQDGVDRLVVSVPIKDEVGG